MRSVPRYYKRDIWSNELVMRESSAGKNLSTEAEDVVGIRHQTTTGEDSKLRRLFMCCGCSVLWRM
jgi:hypothetical protein